MQILDCRGLVSTAHRHSGDFVPSRAPARRTGRSFRNAVSLQCSAARSEPSTISCWMLPRNCPTSGCPLAVRNSRGSRGGGRRSHHRNGLCGSWRADQWPFRLRSGLRGDLGDRLAAPLSGYYHWTRKRFKRSGEPSGSGSFSTRVTKDPGGLNLRATPVSRPYSKSGGVGVRQASRACWGPAGSYE